MFFKHQPTLPPEKLLIVSFQEELVHNDLQVFTPLFSSFSLLHHHQNRALPPTLCDSFSETTYKEDLQYQTLKDAVTTKLKPTGH